MQNAAYCFINENSASQPASRKNSARESHTLALLRTSGCLLAKYARAAHVAALRSAITQYERSRYTDGIHQMYQVPQDK